MGTVLLAVYVAGGSEPGLQRTWWMVGRGSTVTQSAIVALGGAVGVRVAPTVSVPFCVALTAIEA